MKVYLEFTAAYFVAFAVVHTGLLVLAAIQLRRATHAATATVLRRTVRSPLAPPISILVPAYNEEAGIVDSVRSLLALEYPTTELVVVSDGSTDSTVARMIEAFDLRPATRPTPPFLAHAPVRGVYVPRGRLRLILVDKDNGGKADSLNAGINFARFPLVCCIDADSILEQDALVKAAMPFIEDPLHTVATGGVVRIANGCRIVRGRVVEAALPRTALPMFQVVEYLRAFFAARTGWSALNGLLIVSGAFGIFRKDAVIAAGGYRTDTVGEDMELVVRLHRTMREVRRPYRIVYVPDPVCWTEGPESLRILRRQRRRWQQGTLETLLAHRRMLLAPRYRAAGLLALPSVLLFEIVGPLVELLGYVVSIVAFALGAISIAAFGAFLALAFLYGLALSLGAVVLEDAGFGRHPNWDDLRRVLFYAVLENLGYRQFTHLWKLEGFWGLLRGGGWGAMERKGLSRPVEDSLAGEVGLR
jgi:cellulose synthase/poly-beta-1,6-N-acetylglucosamine synthase-like glycosyltransferase